jgi:hypothetical protein
MNFKPMYDLESLTEQQRQEYYLSACEYFNVPANLSLLAFMWMDAGDAKRNLVLYAKKGATDIIRGNLGISTTKLTKDVGEGYVAWIAEGRDKNGRIEQAVGSASIHGLKGQSLASAVMIAQTRATRRMTLQFVGGGLLDESELNETTTDINRAGGSLASMATLPAPQPVVEANVQAGKDVTKEESPKYVIPVDTLGNRELPLKVGGQTQKFEYQKAPEPFSSGSIIPEKVEQLVQIEEAPAETVRTRRKRRTKAEMDAARNNILVTAAEDFGTSYESVPNVTKPFTPEQFDANGPPNIHSEPMPPIFPEITQPPIEDLPNIIKSLYESAVQDEYPTVEQEAGYRDRLKVYTNDVLKAGGMKDGVIWRVRKYTMAMFPEAVIENGKLKLTVKQWDTLLEDFDKRKSNPQDLVAAINVVAEKA